MNDSEYSNDDSDSCTSKVIAGKAHRARAGDRVHLHLLHKAPMHTRTPDTHALPWDGRTHAYLFYSPACAPDALPPPSVSSSLAAPPTRLPSL